MKYSNINVNNSHRTPLKSSLLQVAVMLTSSATRCAAFTTPSPTTFNVQQVQKVQQITTTTLNSHAIDAEDEAMMMMMKANTCANSETCSIEEANEYLNEMLHIQSNCATGTLSSDLICNDISFPTEVIAGLRDKIQNQVELSNQGSAFKIGWNPVFLTVLALYTSSGVLSLAHNNPDTFTMEEWMYALKGGYLDDMVSQYLKYGGLSPITTATSETNSLVVPFTLQEWYWSIRDGYFTSMMSENMNHGGFLSIVEEGTNPEDMVLTTPLTSQEWSTAIKDGYLTNMIDHYMRNGGL